MVLQDVAGGTRKLNSGYHIPLIGFGTYKVVGEQVETAIDAALSAGYRMFDTAKYYKNESEIGTALQKLLPKYNLSREDVFITTKTFPIASASHEETEKLVEESLKNLKTEYIDLYLVHYPKPDVCDNEDPRNKEYRMIAYQALENCQKTGKIRSIGVSNYEIEHLMEIECFSRVKPSVNQLEYHPHFTRKELKKFCDSSEIFFQAFSSLARHEPKLIEDKTVVELAEKYNVSVPILLLSWALSQGVGIVPKSTTPSRIVENFKVKDTMISPEDIDKLSNLDKNQHYIRCTGWLVK